MLNIKYCWLFWNIYYLLHIFYDSRLFVFWVVSTHLTTSVMSCLLPGSVSESRYSDSNPGHCEVKERCDLILQPLDFCEELCLCLLLSRRVCCNWSWFETPDEGKESFAAGQRKIPLIRNEERQLEPTRFQVELSFVISEPSNKPFRVLGEKLLMV